MKRKYLFSLLPIMAISLTSCGEVTHYSEHLEDYAFTMKYHNKFNILQLTDIHWNINTPGGRCKKYLQKVIDETKRKLSETGEKIDLIEITGDSFMLSNSRYVKEFISFFESLDIPYATIWGNHDRQGKYNPNWLSDQFRKAKNSIYIEPDNDDLYGRSNFVINLTEDGTDSSATKWQIANLDSGASYSDNVTQFFKTYDYIREEQTDWWKKEHDRVGSSVPVVAYYHIPQQENILTWEQVQNGATNYNNYFKLEDFAESEVPSNFFEVAKANNLKGCFMGHAHANDWTVEIDGVTVGLGVKTGTELYYGKIDVNSNDPAIKATLDKNGITESFDLVGASLITLKDDQTFDLTHLYLNERESGDFVRWVDYK